MDLLGIRKLPYLSRRNFLYEFRQLVPWSILAGLIEGNFGSVVVSKTFGGSELLIAIAAATPVAALMFSLPWGMLCVGRPKIRLALIFAGSCSLLAGMAGAVPRTESGAVWFIVQMAAAQILLAGIVTVRSAFWKSNYPHYVRGRITAKLQMVRFVVTVFAVMGASAWCDRNPDSYRFIYPLAGLCGLFSAFLLPRIHIRGEKSELRAMRESPRTLQAPRVSLVSLFSPVRIGRQVWDVFRNDGRFTLYCVAQLLAGLSNLLTIAIVVAMVTRDLQRAGPLGLRIDAWGFWISTTIVVAIPRLTMLGSLRRWGQLFDRLGVLGFRVVNLCVWILTLLVGLAAALITLELDELAPHYLVVAVALFGLRGICYGLGIGAGSLAWNLGHLHFAKPGMAEIYMGIHVSLTGLRGLVAPLAGMWLWRWIGWPVWLVAILLAVGSLTIYASMARRERKEARESPSSNS